jgi:ATP-dependent Lon protease
MSTTITSNDSTDYDSNNDSDYIDPDSHSDDDSLESLDSSDNDPNGEESFGEYRCNNENRLRIEPVLVDPKLPSDPKPKQGSWSEKSEKLDRESSSNLTNEWVDELEEELKQTDIELYKSYKNVKEYLVAEMPSVDDLLRAPMKLSDRARIIEWYELFISCEPLTSEWLMIKDRIKSMYDNSITKYKQYDNIDKDLKIFIDSELVALNEIYEVSVENKIAMLDIPFHSKRFIYQKYKFLQTIDSANDEYSKIQSWLDTVLSIPFPTKQLTPDHQIPSPDQQIPRELSPLNSDQQIIMTRMKSHLDKEFYGLDKIKEQLLVYINYRIMNPHTKDYALGLIGPPGIGKTHLSLLIAKILGQPFCHLSSSSLMSVTGIHGHQYTYIGSEPGGIVKALIQMKSLRGILFIDEFDKIPLEKNLSSLLQLLDPIQNNTFKDHYLGNEIDIDLSSIWFVLSMNQEPEQPALRDRIFTIKLDEYTFKDKISILKNYTTPRIMKELTAAGNTLNITFTDGAYETIVRHSGDASGMRTCINLLKDIVYKLLFMIQHPTITMSFTSFTLSDKFTRITSDIVTVLLKDHISTESHLSMYN